MLEDKFDRTQNRDVLNIGQIVDLLSLDLRQNIGGHVEVLNQMKVSVWQIQEALN